MTTRWHNLSLILGLTTIALSGGCGGRSERDENEGGSGGALPGSGGAAVHEYGGAPALKGGAPGSSGAPGKGGATGRGGAPGDGGAPHGGATGKGGAAYGGATLAKGGGPSIGGAAPGTGGAPNQCQTLADQVPKLIEEAKVCNPALSSEQCTEMLPGGLRCACPTFANPRNKDAVAKINQAALTYDKLSCGGDIECGACLSPVHGYCSPKGRCEDSYEPKGRGCKVGGVVYASGTTNIKNPGSPCNTCACDDGQLTCTDIACASGCPAGTAFGQQCAECGPTDACILTEFDCFPTCSTSLPCPSASQLCLNGLCKAGLCG